MASSKAQAQKRRRLVNKAFSHLEDLPIDMVRDFPFEPMYLVFWRVVRKLFIFWLEESDYVKEGKMLSSCSNTNNE